MENVRVSKTELLEKVMQNRNQHAELFKKAQEGFIRRWTEEMHDMMKAAENGDVRLYVGLTPPSDHTAEYNRAIRMLEMSQDDTIEIDTETFAQLVMNEWQWFNQATAINATYASGGKMGGSR